MYLEVLSPSERSTPLDAPTLRAWRIPQRLVLGQFPGLLRLSRLCRLRAQPAEPRRQREPGTPALGSPPRLRAGRGAGRGWLAQAPGNHRPLFGPSGGAKVPGNAACCGRGSCSPRCRPPAAWRPTYAWSAATLGESCAPCSRSTLPPTSTARAWSASPSFRLAARRRL